MRKPTLFDGDINYPELLHERQPGIVIDGKFATKEQLVEYKIPIFTSEELVNGTYDKYWRRRNKLAEKKGWTVK